MRVLVRPAKGLKVRDHVSKRHLPPEGVFLEMSSYWVRRQQDGDVEIVSSESEETIPTEKPDMVPVDVVRGKESTGGKRK